MAQAFANEDLDRFSVADVLAAFGLPVAARGPCPLCHTSERSQAFWHLGYAWGCHACQRRGNQIGLYAALAGVSYGRAVRAIAGHLGISEADPADLLTSRLAAARAASERQELSEIAGTVWRARLRRRDRLRASIAEIQACTPLSWSVLGNLYAALGRVEDWIESREYEMRGWL